MFFCSVPSLIFNSVVCFMDEDLDDFTSLIGAMRTNKLCRAHWKRNLCKYVHKATPLFSVFLSRKKLLWTIEEGIDAYDWVLKIPGVKGAATGGVFTWCCEREHIDVMQAMVSRTKVDVEAGYPDSADSPLLWSAREGKRRSVVFLCEQGADLEARGIEGKTPLHRAAQAGHLLVVQYLCEQGAEKEARDEDGWSPLYWAAANGNLPLVQYL